ncbi:MAG: GNAT family N-acetyltransferase [Bacteroidales bacterium]|nr:GNAT family N-acetyltransferase [Bacteroidales bacterium]
MTEPKLFHEDSKPDETTKKNIIDFLFHHLEQYGDSWEDIKKAVDYSLKEYHSFGGFLLVSYEGEDISGVVVVNQTGMSGYIPENILVYIATHNEMRGKGIGKYLMKKAIENAKGDIALHVEPDNPARFLYEKVGFTSKYMEMRFKQPAG